MGKANESCHWLTLAWQSNCPQRRHQTLGCGGLGKANESCYWLTSILETVALRIASLADTPICGNPNHLIWGVSIESRPLLGNVVN